ncbi:low affinity Fe/Cu permease [Terrimicrobium sacchariphilum]|uniref:Low affinity Fe/Cu permease n=1 Tax=Terrimicrobium sacchariphilum TaxID=690879 RepID=A0A146G9P4_TERSA|nr:low affinity iron permease family protein [Terrimicrobium sacchariphilum]GAT33584.1 low affinity Fe/Cu permease [Terrimicrobium sacchariphilum]
MKARTSSHRTSWFTRFAQRCAHWSGQPVTFVAAVGLLVVWGISGPIFGFSDTWQLIINTSTTIVTFLMVFLIQNTQNRDTEALQIKLDELIRATRAANNSMLDLEKLEEADLDRIRADYEQLAEKARSEITNRKSRRRKSD